MSAANLGKKLMEGVIVVFLFAALIGGIFTQLGGLSTNGNISAANLTIIVLSGTVLVLGFVYGIYELFLGGRK